MASNPSSADVSLLVSRNSVREKLRDQLRLHVGRGRRYSVKELSNGTGVPDRKIESAMCDVESTDYRPLTLEELASIAKFLSVPFVAPILELCGLGAFELMDGQRPLDGVFDEPCVSPNKLSRDDHIRKAHEHLTAAEAMAE